MSNGTNDLISNVVGTLSKDRKDANEPAFDLKKEWDSERQEWVYQIRALQGQLEPIIADVQKYRQLMQGFAAEQFKQAQAVKENPWGNIAATIAGNMAAADPKLPGWVRGLGKASLELNPNADELQRRGAAYQSEGLKAAESALGLQERLLSHRGASIDRTGATLGRLDIARERSREQAFANADRAVKNMNTSPAFYKATLEKYITDPEQLDEVVKGLVQDATDNRKLKEGHEKYLVDKAKADREIRDVISKRQTELGRARNEIARSREEFHQKVVRGDVVDVKWLKSEERKWTELQQKVIHAAKKDGMVAASRAAGIKTQYLGVSMLDKTGAWGTSIERDIGALEEGARGVVAEANLTLEDINDHVADIRRRISEIEGGTARPARLRELQSSHTPPGGKALSNAVGSQTRNEKVRSETNADPANLFGN